MEELLYCGGSRCFAECDALYHVPGMLRYVAMGIDAMLVLPGGTRY